MKKILDNNKETKDYLNSLPKVYIAACWAGWGVRDFAFCSKERAKEICSQLNGKKILIKGNHDNWPDEFYKEIGFEYVSKYPILYKNWYLCSHEPLQMFQNVPYKNCYGHVHNDPVYQNTPNAECYCVERIGYRPKLLFERN